jgi:FHA domain
VGDSPLDLHGATPGELQERIRLEERGVPFLVLRDGDGRQLLVELAPDRERVTLGRSRECDVTLAWDHRVSRVHAALERVGGAWSVVDDGLSRNGTWVNGERLAGRHRLRDGDTLRVGAGVLAFRAPGEAGSVSGPTLTAAGAPPTGDVLTPAQRRVLVALCRPYRDSAIATPASNPDIARELTVSVEAVRTTMRQLFELFGIEDLPQGQKRASLALQALRSGAIARRDL